MITVVAVLIMAGIVAMDTTGGAPAPCLGARGIMLYRRCPVRRTAHGIADGFDVPASFTEVLAPRSRPSA